MEVVWSEESFESYLKVVDFLLENWTMNEVENFEANFDRIISQIKGHSESCPKSRLLNFRKCLIDKNNSLIYTVVNGKILLITIVDNNSSHAY